MNPAFLLGTAFNIAYWHRKYHSGTIEKGNELKKDNPEKRLKDKEVIMCPRGLSARKEKIEFLILMLL